MVGLASRRAGIGDYLSIKEMGCVITHRIFGWKRGPSGRRIRRAGRFCEKKCAYIRHADLKGVIERVINIKILISMVKIVFLSGVFRVGDGVS